MSVDDILTRLRSELAGRYTVEHELGRGGMAVVYLAQDERHSRRVALKVLRPDSGSADAAERFLHEIRTIAQLHHPHILPLHDSGVAGGHFFYVMPYVDGESLRQRLERTGPLPVDEAVQLAREVADALAFAHERGVIHRDIKPENILIASGHAAVADFGIARAMNAAGLRITDVGMAVGTPTYMSPEQATAADTLDGRADQYSLGCVVYEMLAGTPPFTGPSSRAVMARHTLDPVPPLRTVRPDLPPTLEPAIVRALAKLPADRWPTTREFAAALDASVRTPTGTHVGSTSVSRKWVRAALIVTVLVGTSGLAWKLGGGRTAADSAEIPSVGVVPFAFSGDTNYAYLAEGLSENLTNGLFRVGGIRTAASSRMTRCRGPEVDPQRCGQGLGLTMVITARVHVANNRIRVSPQIIRVADGSLVWSGENLDGEAQSNGRTLDLFTIQDQMNAKIAGAILPRLTAAQRAVAAIGARTKDAEAWRMYREARRLTALGGEANVTRAKGLLDSAIARDSSFSDAWSALVTALDNVAHFSSRSPHEFRVEMRRAYNRAVDLDPASGYARAQRGMYRILDDWDWTAGLADVNKGRELEPGSLDVESIYQGVLAWLDMGDSVLTLARKAHDPSNIDSWANLVLAFVSVRQWDSVVVAAERVDAMDSSYVWNDLSLADAYLETNRPADAARAIQRFVRRVAYQSDAIGIAAAHFRRAGDRRGLLLMRERLDSVRRTTIWSVNSAEAIVRLGLGDREGALAYLDTAIREHEYLVPVMLSWTLDPLRDDPRFIAAKQRVWGGRSLPRYYNTIR